MVLESPSEVLEFDFDKWENYVAEVEYVFVLCGVNI